MPSKDQKMRIKDQVPSAADTNFYLFETMRREPDAEIVRLDLHLRRLETASRELGFSHDPGRISDALASLPEAGHQQRIRLTLQRDGSCCAQAYPFEPVTNGTIWTLAIAETRLSSTDRLLRHKSSRRGVYDAARAEFAAETAQEVLLLNEKGELCEGTITSLFVRLDDGPLKTPSLQCGLLAGVLRQSLLKSGQAEEAVLLPDDLAHATEIFVGNSLRGLIRARLNSL